MIWKAAAYLRISRAIEDNNEINSLDNQKSIIEDYVTDKKYLTIVDYYIDNGFSGTHFNRPEFERMMDDVREGKVNCIIVKDMSRFIRNYGWGQLYLGEYLPSLNVRFISITENLDSIDDPNYTDRLDFSLLSLVYEHYAIDASQKVTAIKRMQQHNGDYLGVSAPYGYIKDPNDGHKILIDDYSSQIVKRIFDMTLDCKSRREIVNILNEEKVLPPSKYKAEVIKVTSESTKIAKEWTPDMIREILKNEVYIGNMFQGKIKKPNRRLNKIIKVKKDEWVLVENTHEAIINKKDFAAVQRFLEFSPTMLKSEDLLLIYLKCPDCNGTFHKKKTKYNEYYYCNTYYRNKGCTKHAVIKYILEDMVLESIKENVDNSIKELNKELLDKYVNAIYIFENGNIEVDYK